MATSTFLTYQLVRSKKNEETPINSIYESIKNKITKLKNHGLGINKSHKRETYIIKDGLGNSFEHVVDSTEENLDKVKDFIEDNKEDADNLIKISINKAKSQYYDIKSDFYKKD